MIILINSSNHDSLILFLFLKDKKHFYKFYKILRGQSDEENLSKITDHVFRCFDKDGNGYLDFSGIILAFLDGTISFQTSIWINSY